MKRKDKETIWIGALLATGPPPTKDYVINHGQNIDVEKRRARTKWEQEVETYIYRGYKRHFKKKGHYSYAAISNWWRSQYAEFYEWLEREQRRRR